MTGNAANKNCAPTGIDKKEVLMSLLAAFAIRIAIVAIVELVFEKGGFYKLVYTDVDYKIYIQAASKVLAAQSPYQRHTYRYTPLLSYLMIPSVLIHASFGKLVFSLTDMAIGWILLFPLKCSLKSVNFWWLFNPFVIVIGTRGSSDSIVGFLVLLFMCYEEKLHHFTSGFMYGLAVHFKIYPIIFSITILKRYLSKRKREIFIFICGASLSFGVLGLVFFYFYGWEFVFESFLYHLVRKDHRHNFSPLFYPIYYWLQNEEEQSNVSGIAMLLPSIGSWFLTGFLSDASQWKRTIFNQTCLFVIFNKVITSQVILLLNF